MLKEMLEFGKRAIELFESYDAGALSEAEFISEMQKMRPRESDLYLECNDLEEMKIFAATDNMFLIYSESGLKTWPDKVTRDFLMKDTIKLFFENVEKLKCHTHQ